MRTASVLVAVAAVIGSATVVTGAGSDAVSEGAVVRRRAERSDAVLVLREPGPGDDPVATALYPLLDELRAEYDLAPLRPDHRVAAAATAHAVDLATIERVQHIGSDGTRAGDRLDRVGYRATIWGENLAAGFTNAADVLTAWMNSPSHRVFLLGDFTHVGIGSAIRADGARYWVFVGASGG